MTAKKQAPTSAAHRAGPAAGRRGGDAPDPDPSGVPGPARALTPAADVGTTESEAPEAAAAAEAPPSRVVVEVYRGDISALYADVAIVGRYKGVGARGPAHLFDRRLHGWLSSAIELGMVASDLGELFYIPLTRPDLSRPAAEGAAAPQVYGWKDAPEALVVAGLGEPGRFNREGLRFLMTNFTLFAVTQGCGKLSAPLLGFSRGEMVLESVLRGTLEGVSDALSRLGRPKDVGPVLRLIHPDKDVVKRMWQGCGDIGEDGIRGLHLQFMDKRDREVGGPDPTTGKGRRAAAKEHRLPRLAEGDREAEHSTRLTITSASDHLVGPAGAAQSNWQCFQYAALAESAVIPVREQLVQAYFVSHLPQRLVNAPFAKHETYGKLLSSYLIPEDFRKLIEAGDPLTLVLDSSTALYPWEMAGFKGYRGTAFFGIQLKLARQFRTLLSAAPGIAPPVNHCLHMLIIADPAPDLKCPGARTEALAILETLEQIRQSWERLGKELRLEVTLRLGPPDTDPPAFNREALRRYRFLLPRAGQNHDPIGPCDPVELLELLLNEHFDVVHYAGHGVFDPEGQRMGWVFGKDNCILSAAEIFCVRQVPRLVFANACWSAALPKSGAEREKELALQHRLQVGLAEAFFARGIQNYIGAGWPVEDGPAATFAQEFYGLALGLPAAIGGNGTGRPRPATLGTALAGARQLLFTQQKATWGAYQHYGHSGARLLTPPEDDAEEDAP
jgi:hypothetical protein